MNIKQKLTLGLSTITLFVIITGLVGILNINTINQKLNLVTTVTTPTVELADDMIITMWKSNNAIQQYAVETNPDTLEDIRETFDKLTTHYDEAELKIKKLLRDETILENINIASNKQRTFRNTAIEMTSMRKNELAATNPNDKSLFKERKAELANQLIRLTDETTAVLEEVAIRVNTFNQQADLESLKAVNTTMFLLILTTILSILFATLAGIYLANSILKPINHLTDAAAHISKGNLTVDVPPSHSNDEISHLTTTFNLMTRSIRTMLRESPRLKQFLDIPNDAKNAPATLLEPGTSYLLKDPTPTRAYDILLAKTTQGTPYLCLTRANPTELQEKYGVEPPSLVLFSDTKDPHTRTTTDLPTLTKTTRDFLTKNPTGVILLDRADYLISKHTFPDVFHFLLRLNDYVLTTQANLLLILDPATINPKEATLLEKEFKTLPKPALTPPISQELLTILKHIQNQHTLRRPVTFKDISKTFHITAPTTKKKLFELHTKNLITITKQGRNKLLDLTKNGTTTLTTAEF